MFDLKISHKIDYLSEEPIYCHVKLKDYTGERVTYENLSHMSTIEIRRILITSESDEENRVDYHIILKVGQDPKTQEHARSGASYANKFNDESTSDFSVKCSNDVFYVHKWILADRSEYF